MPFVHSPLVQRRRAAACFLFASLLVAGGASAQTFPTTTPPWQPLTTSNGQVLYDPRTDISPGGELDIVGDNTTPYPSFYIANDGTYVYFRFRLDDTALQGGTLKASGWGCEIVTIPNTNPATATYQYFIDLDGKNNTLTLYNKGSDGTPANSPTQTAQLPAFKTYTVTYPFPSVVQQVTADSTFNSTPDYFLELAVPLADLQAAGIGPTTQMQFICGSTANARNLSKDILDSSGANTLTSAATDPVVCDATGCRTCLSSTCGASCLTCSGATPFCNATTGTCVACTSNSNCTSATAPACVNGTCVACTSDNGCSGHAGTPACNTTTGRCVQCSGTNATACSGALPACNTTTNTCVQCTSTNASACTGSTPACNTLSNTCVQCTSTSASACTGGTPVCDPTTSTCVQCLSSASCSGATPACDTTTHTCVACVQSTDCPTGATCNTASETCSTPAPVVSSPADGSVTNSTQPPISGSGTIGTTITVYVDGNPVGTTTVGAGGTWSFTPPISLGVGQHMVSATATAGSGANAVTSGASNTNTFTIVSGCIGNGDCGGTTPVCNTTTHTCVECLTTTNCGGGTPLCSATGSCVQCLGNGNCSGATPVCNTSNGTCVACVQTSDCATGATCSGNQCVLAAPVVSTPANGAILNDAQPAISGTGVAGATVTVYLDGAAIGTATVGAGGTWSFTPPMSLSTGQHSVRATETVGTGATAVTSGSSNTNTFTLISGCLVSGDCSGVTPVCNLADHVCVQCLVDGDCGGATPVCNTATHTCVQCTSSTSCGGATPVCDTSRDQCVECVSASDCGGSRPVCDASGVCVACVLTADCPTGATCAANQCTTPAPVVQTPANGSTINNAQPPIGGTGTVGATITVYVDGVALGTTVVGAGGTWSFTPPVSLSTGSHSVRATATVGSGATAVTSASSNTNTFTIISGCLADGDCSGATPHCDTSNNTCMQCLQTSDCPSGATCSSNTCVLPPPTIATPADGSTINNPRPAITGTATAGATVTVSLDGVVLGTAVADGSGNWSFTPTSDVAAGDHVLTATAMIGSGASAASSAPSRPDRFTEVNGCLSDADCSAPTAFCVVATHTCLGCNGDLGSGATRACPTAASPWCSSTGACGTCGGNSDCNGHPSGNICNLSTGACGTACVNDTDCASTEWCAAGVCTAKTPNGQPVPSTAPINGQCTPANGARVCVSGVCDTSNNTCGFTNGKGCTDPAQCQSNDCASDGKCGEPNDTPCTSATICRSDICFPDGRCGEPNGTPCATSGQCRSACYPVDDLCGAPNGAPCTAAGDCRSQVCNADRFCGDPNGTPCQGAVTCRSGICAGGTCGATCSTDGDCDASAFCDAGACKPQRPNGQPCDRARQCTSAVCDADGKCGTPDGGGCSDPSTCRSSACVNGTCGGTCTQDSECASRTFCASNGTCTAAEPNGQPCTRARQCTSAVCGADGKCGLPDGQPCATVTVCRGGICDGAGTCASSGCNDDSQCPAGTYCDLEAATCMPDKTNSTVCTRNGECLSGVCFDNMCGEPDGTACGLSLVCRSNLCVGGVCGEPPDMAQPDLSPPPDLAQADLSPEADLSTVPDLGAGDLSAPRDLANTPTPQFGFAGGGFCSTGGGAAAGGAWLILLLIAAGAWLAQRRRSREGR